MTLSLDDLLEKSDSVPLRSDSQDDELDGGTFLGHVGQAVEAQPGEKTTSWDARNDPSSAVNLLPSMCRSQEMKLLWTFTMAHFTCPSLIVEL